MKKILIADDEPVITQTLAEYLQARPCETTIAQNGNQVLNLILNNPFDLVVLDLNMPDIDGLEVLWQMRANGLETPVLILTGYGAIEHADIASQMGVKISLTKPVKANDFLHAVDSILDFAQAPTHILSSQIEAYLHANFSNPNLTYPTLLAHFNISKSYAYKVLSKHLKPFTPLLTEIRLQHACTLLRTTDKQIQEVAAECGFSSTKRLSTLFQNRLGLSPTQYRKKGNPEGKS